MAATPEGKVKQKLKKLLAEYENIYTFWPVPMGIGETTLDVLGCYRGRFFAVETKKEGGKPTLRQQTVIENIASAMGKTWVIAGLEDPAFDDLRAWLNMLKASVHHAPDLTPDQVRRRTI
jgi:hypothetical protein